MQLFLLMGPFCFIKSHFSPKMSSRILSRFSARPTPSLQNVINWDFVLYWSIHFNIFNHNPHLGYCNIHTFAWLRNHRKRYDLLLFWFSYVNKLITSIENKLFKTDLISPQMLSKDTVVRCRNQACNLSSLFSCVANKTQQICASFFWTLTYSL